MHGHRPFRCCTIVLRTRVHSRSALRSGFLECSVLRIMDYPTLPSRLYYYGETQKQLDLIAP